jgi:hypothetical protein
MTATDLDLDALLDALTARALERAATAGPLKNAAGQPIDLAANTGRVRVNPGDIIASAWGNLVFDQSMQAYTSDSDRNTQWPAPVDGAICYTADAAAGWLRRAGAWKGIPLGTVAQAISTTNSPSTTTNIDWFSAPSFTTPGNRRIKVSFGSLVNAGVNNDLINVRLMEGSTVLQTSQVRPTAAGGLGQITAFGIWQGMPGAGTHTYKLNIALTNGTGPVSAIAGPAQPALLLVEDIGN